MRSRYIIYKGGDIYGCVELNNKNKDEIIDSKNEFGFFDFLGDMKYLYDDQKCSCSSRRTFDIMWSRVQNISYIVSKDRKLDYSDEFVFGALIKFYSDKIFDTTLESGVKFFYALEKIDECFSKVYNDKKDACDLTSHDMHIINLVSDRINENTCSMTSAKKYETHECVTSVMCNILYGNMSCLGIEPIDITNLMIMMAAVECDKYLSDKNRDRYITFINEFFASVNEMFESFVSEFGIDVCDNRVYDSIEDYYKKICVVNKGEIHWNWKGGITPENEKFRASSEYKKWRMSVLKRDNYTCHECGGSNGGNLNVHHILPYRDYRDPEYSLDVDNGITLCEECHDKVSGKEYEFVDRYQKIVNNIRLFL